MHSQNIPAFDLVIIGGGAAGLTAAYMLSASNLKIALVEARDRLGGRIHTVAHSGYAAPLERGAEFIHGNLEETNRLLKEAGLLSVPIEGSIWQKEGNGLKESEDFIADYDGLQEKFALLQEDCSVESFMNRHLAGDPFAATRKTLCNYIEGYYAANAAKASMQALVEELTTADEEQFRVSGGYGGLVRYLEQQSRLRGCTFYLQTPVRHIRWSKERCTVEGDGLQLSARKILITLPSGVLTAPPSSSSHIRFTPSIENVRQMYGQIGYGPVIKFLLLFREPFWENTAYTRGARLKDLLFLFSEEAVPTWWTQHPASSSLLTGWLAGPKAAALKEKKGEELLSLALESLSSLFSVSHDFLSEQLLYSDVANWAADPYSLGAYNYHTVESIQAQEAIKAWGEGVLFFAGEALQPGPQIGTVEAAIRTGKEAAEKIGQALLDREASG